MPPFNQHNINPISPHLQHRLLVCQTKGQQHHRVRGMDNNHRTRIHLPLPSLISKIKAIFRQVRYIPNGQVRQNTVLPVRKWQRATPDEWQRGKPAEWQRATVRKWALRRRELGHERATRIS
ncbi:Uncharacterized protein Fot_19813 [Forsythia ovata]|uniref:Uncharacterized protein n=1 Tax=Forsythia ovata TaxID=205694 RepID=A0ABD1VM36_9LAMI